MEKDEDSRTQARPRQGARTVRPMANDTDFAETRAAREAWDELGRRNELLPADHFRNEIAPDSAYFDLTTHWPKPGPRRSGPQSIALQDVINGSCQGWPERPTGTELYNAFRAANPTTRELALLRTWFVEATVGQLVEAWAQQAYSDRQLVESIHRIGFTRTDTPRFAVRIRLINSWAVR